VLFVEGDNASPLFDLSRPEQSQTARRNTNLFQSAVRLGLDEVPYAEYLIHRTEKGELVRSKSELVIANILYQVGLEYQYERVCEGTVEPGKLRPDFSFVDSAGDLILWEHLGMMDREDYRLGWEWKRKWYEKNGFVMGKTLFTSQESPEAGLDSIALKATAVKVKELLS